MLSRYAILTQDLQIQLKCLYFLSYCICNHNIFNSAQCTKLFLPFSPPILLTGMNLFQGIIYNSLQIGTRTKNGYTLEGIKISVFAHKKLFNII